MKRPQEIDQTFDDLANSLDDTVAGRPILFFINPGNWGDSLIREGAETFLREKGFRYHTVRFRDILKGRLTLQEAKEQSGFEDPAFVFNGNGWFVGRYGGIETLASVTAQFETSIFLPLTLTFDPFGAGFPLNSRFFVRDRFQSQDVLPNAPFCHDMAFYLELESNGQGKGEGWLFREDTEAPKGQILHKSNRDISKLGKAHTPIEGFIEAIDQFETIHTNRLHVGIASALLGKKVNLYANDYFKIRAIYESSIKPYFPNVTFRDAPTIAPQDRMRWRHRIARRLGLKDS